MSMGHRSQRKSTLQRDNVRLRTTFNQLLAMRLTRQGVCPCGIRLYEHTGNLLKVGTKPLYTSNSNGYLPLNQAGAKLLNRINMGTGLESEQSNRISD